MVVEVNDQRGWTVATTFEAATVEQMTYTDSRVLKALCLEFEQVRMKQVDGRVVFRSGPKEAGR